MEPTSTQVGAIAENLVINALVTASKGRIAPFRPFADDEGIDILAYDKESGSAIPIQVKARTVTLFKPKTKVRGNLAHFEVRKVVLDRNKRSVLVAALLTEDLKEIRDSWLIPMRELKRLANERASKWVIRPSISKKGKDRYRAYYHHGVATLVMELLKQFKKPA